MSRSVQLPDDGKRRATPRGLLILAAVIVFAAAVLAAGAGLALNAQGDVLQVRFGGDAERTRIVVDMDRTARGSIRESGEAGRVVLSLSGVSAGQGASGRGLGLVRAYEMQGSGGGAELRLDLAGGAEVERRFLLPPGDGVTHYRYVIDLKATDAVVAARPERNPPRTASVPQRREPPLIVIDAGHGGHDPGTRGGRVNESAVTLQAARALKTELERIGGYRVLLTRDADVYVTRSRRVAMAREAGADLFISLHADAGHDRTTRGASVYTLSEQGAVRAVRQATSRDGWHAELHLPGRDPTVDRILLDMTQRATQNRSAQAARVVLTHLEASGHPMLNRSHRDANFEVLLAPDVPALLLEMGFMTNPDDEQLLTDERGRTRLMRATAQGIDRYFSQPDAGLMVASGGQAGGAR
ncbi:MAG: N-acetylmuramoyl-L-alanine amidase [Brevundimonas sp.]|uniref:N-acetylmuramoyl-L-alanine amidase family protein n=1 Tax=Brevundimonas sp. TaxID=1871086 RepID=UPI00391B4D0A